jgi:hypothetical protein
MHIEITEQKRVDVKTLAVRANVRYWEDAEINGVADEEGDLTPFADGDSWNLKVEIEAGKIIDWPTGTVASIHFKVCDGFSFWLLDENDEVVYTSEEGYVPKFFCPKEAGYGDYIIMDIDADGVIQKWDKAELARALDE